MPALISVQVGRPREVDDGDGRWTSAIWKSPVDGPVEAGSLGLVGDGVADSVAHGGVDKAVLSYSQDHDTAWGEELPGLDRTAGAFGENLRVSGLTEEDVCIGDEWLIGEVRLQVSQPRQPCWKLARKHRQPDLVKRVVRTGRSGWYLRVLQEGTLSPGPVDVVARPRPEWPVSRAQAALYGRPKDMETVGRLLLVPELAEAWREAIR